MLDEKFNEGIVLQKEQSYGETKRSAGPCSFMGFEATATCYSPDSPNPQFSLEAEKSASLGSNLGNGTVSVVNVPLLMAVWKT